ncbi:terpene synthase family protein [Chitinophaga varians]|uniref:terpene synthase family protein n=1 Tax=Chitinophaga varians TaxID=2202339 RepID=UPI00165FB112|nr:hypothetical protein [Chitinophaga varians]MBC9910367.1 hypothetical protein [Chitinophaga varians]
MDDLKIPPLYCPFHPFISNHFPAVRKHTDSWIASYQLLSKEEYERYDKDNFAAMTCRFYEGSAERLGIANDLLTLFFRLDDLADHADKGVSDFFLREFLVVLHDGHYYGNVPFFRALGDVWGRFVKHSAVSLQQRITADIRSLFNGIAWERRNAEASRWPTLDEYFKMRPAAGGAALAGTLVRFVSNLKLPAKFLDSREYMVLNTLCGRLGCLANDILSVKKELAHQDYHNLIVLLQQLFDLSLQEAINQAVVLHNQHMELFSRSIAGVSRREWGPAVQQYIDGLIGIVRGNLDWSLNDSERYGYHDINTDGYVVDDADDILEKLNIGEGE